MPVDGFPFSASAMTRRFVPIFAATDIERQVPG